MTPQRMPFSLRPRIFEEPPHHNKLHTRASHSFSVRYAQFNQHAKHTGNSGIPRSQIHHGD